MEEYARPDAAGFFVDPAERERSGDVGNGIEKIAQILRGKGILPDVIDGKQHDAQHIGKIAVFAVKGAEKAAAENALLDDGRE